MKKTIASLFIILSVLTLTACQPDQPATQNTQDTQESGITQQDNQTRPQRESIDIDAEKSAEIDKQVAEDTEKFSELGLDGEITKEDCEQLKNEKFRADCIELVELESQ